MSHTEALQAYKMHDFEKAVSLFETLAEEKNDQAMVNLGLMYLKGEGVKKDALKAKEWFERASEYENDSAFYNLALMYQSAIGVKEDLVAAVEYFRKAVKQKHQGAYFRLALILLKDRNEVELVKEGFECMLQAAFSGHPMAKMQLSGLSVTPNLTCKKNESFRAKSFEEQKMIVEDAIQRYIRPILVKDGGNIILIDFNNQNGLQINLAYQGNCAGCSLASTSTYELIRNTLMQVIDEDIKVYVL